MPLSSLFIGVPQSKYAAFAIMAAVLVVSFTLLFGKDPIPFTQKMAFVLLLFLISLPGILLTLFQMTCLVTGAGFNNKRWWCSAYAWIVSVLLVIYCVMLIAVSIISLSTGEKVLSEILSADVENFEDVMASANKEAKEYFVGETPSGSADAASDIEMKKEAEPKKPVVAVEAPAEKFKVAGGASQPEPLKAPELPAVPEGFEDASIEMFSSCASPY